MELNTLVERATRGDAAAFGRLLTQHWRFVYTVYLSHVGHAAEAEDLTQEVFVRALPLDGEPHAVSDIFYHLFPHDLPPTFVVDISDYVGPWVEALQCHRSQFYDPHTQRYEAIERFLALAHARGFARGVGYAHAFIARAPLAVDDPVLLVAHQVRTAQDPSSVRLDQSSSGSLA